MCKFVKMVGLGRFEEVMELVILGCYGFLT
jgi:hypothetical protein